MKKITILLALLATIYTTAQDNFTTEYNYLTWSKEYKTKLTKKQISEILVRNAALRNLTKHLTGNTEYISKNCTYKNTAIFMRNPFTSFVIIEVNDNTTKVTLNGIKFQAGTTMTFGSISSTDADSAAETYLLRKKDNTIRKNKQAQKDLACLNETFINMFSFLE